LAICQLPFAFCRFLFTPPHFHQLPVVTRLAVDQDHLVVEEEQIGVIGDPIHNFGIFDDASHQISPAIHMALYLRVFWGFFSCHWLIADS
jgi:hypothetical protein